jgi:hypothetical protein
MNDLINITQSQNVTNLEGDKSDNLIEFLIFIFVGLAFFSLQGVAVLIVYIIHDKNSQLWCENHLQSDS